MPKGEELKLKDKLNNLPFRIDEEMLHLHNVTYFLIHQKENEAIFVPSGWYHQVLNVKDTISINHNWFNGTNIKKIWLNLSEQMRKVRQEIDDCQDMDNFQEHCEKILKADFGMNFTDFIELLEFIAESRKSVLDNYKTSNNNNFISNEETTNKINHNEIFNTESFQSVLLYKFNDFHLEEDLRQIYQVVLDIIEDIVILKDQNFLLERCKRLKALTAGF